MKILVLSDIHGKLNKLEDVLEVAGVVDLVVIIGDITDFGPEHVAEKILDRVRQYNKNIIAIPGNCDPNGIEDVIKDKGKLADGIVVKEGGFEFIGMGGSNPTPFNTPREYKETEIEDKAINLFERVNPEEAILLSHFPVKGGLDKTKVGHAGSEKLKEVVEEFEPFLIFTGHIHEAIGDEKLGTSRIVNPGAVRDGRAAIAEINDNKEVDLKFIKL